ncbi:aconitase X swivel domain-containing protein [Desulforhopalus singaporensis]|uniref:Predicted aconitase subunit 2 n=1 Tax=Desulforhopalus singaporensis TaxID=91360 RepID=A0A1H0UD95_9BACT|nr:DUF126 domain-containing protein [Desulforhopalus singaporensis]SDP64159.1 predicted aconitase subunit 2 [Desulforhopalus singaporensis]
MGTKFKCKKISKGCVEGKVIISKDALCYYLVEPESGTVVERNHDLEGRNVAGKVLIMPSGKGSSVVQADGIYKLSQHGNSPLGMIIEHADPVLVSSAIIFEVPMVHEVDPEFYAQIIDGDTIVLDATNGVLEIKK